MVQSQQKNFYNESQSIEEEHIGTKSTDENKAPSQMLMSRPGLPKVPIPQKQQYYLNEILNTGHKKSIKNGGHGGVFANGMHNDE